MFVVDLIITLFQGIFIAYVLNKCLNEKNYIKSLSIVLFTILITSDFICDYYEILQKCSTLMGNLIVMIFIGLIYKKHIKESLTVYSICMILLNTYFVLTSNLVLEVLSDIFNIDAIKAMIYVVYIPQLILILLLIKKIDIIERLFEFIIYDSMEISIIAINMIEYYLVVFYRLSLGEYSQLVKNLLEIIMGICIILLIIYFNKIHNKTKKICALNEALENKNSELRRIKHDYGAQISYLYGLVLMERYDDLKKSLKDIINVNQNTAGAVEVKIAEEKYNESILSMAVKVAIDKGIHVILEEKFDINLIKVSEIELYRIVMNIVNNAIKAMDGQGRIIVRAYELMNKVIIEIENNGPKIPEDSVNLIFNAGFTTKENNEKNHGYGLSIVKELVESNDGIITVKSTEEKTVFKICFNMI